MLVTQLQKTLAKEDETGWDDFSRRCVFPAYQQSRIWPQAAPQNRRQKYLYATTRENGRIVATAIVRQTPLLGPFWLATSQRGPLVSDPTQFRDVIDSMALALSARGACTWLFAPRVTGRDLPHVAEICRDAGAIPLQAHRQPIHVATATVDLRRCDDDLLASFSQGGRRKLRQAEKADVRVLPVENSTDIERFQEALDQFARNRPDYRMTGQPCAEEQVRMVDKLGGAMLIAECDGVLLGAASFVCNRDEAIWLSLASTDAMPKIPSNYLLLWEEMRQARDQGCQLFDLAGVPLAEEECSPGEKSRLQFKSAFRPERRILLPMQALPLKPLSHAILFNLRQEFRGLLR